VRRIGSLGGMSWELRPSTTGSSTKPSGSGSADCLLRSVDFADVEELQRTARWDDAGELLAGEAQELVAAGAELIVLH
jgi:aspartate racemase